MKRTGSRVGWMFLPVVGVLSAGALTLSSGFTSAQTPDPDATDTPEATETPRPTNTPRATQTPEANETPTPSPGGQSYDEILADELGISGDELREAESRARDRYIDRLVDEGNLTQEQAANLKMASSGEIIGEVFRGGVSNNLVRIFVLSQVAQVLNMDRQELERQLSEGRSLQEVLEEQNVTEEDIQREIDTRFSRLISLAEAAGLISQEESSELREMISDLIDEALGGQARIGQSGLEGANSQSPAEPAATVEVEAVNYDYENLPRTIATGSAIEMTNASDDEAHQLVAIRLPEDEERTVVEIFQALPDEGEGMLEGVVQQLREPSLVLIAGPGAEAEAVFGEKTLNESGRYIFACFVPQGADPQAVLEVARENPISGEPPSDAPPHVALGMFAEVVVE